MSTRPASRDRPEWFDAPRGDNAEPGLRFSCTMCGNCCSGPPGYVAFTDLEAEAMAARLGVGVAEFMERFTHHTPAGRSLREVPGGLGLDCILLDRDSEPGKALCRVYQDRPSQCRTWPFWTHNLSSERAWRQAARTCPGIDRGTHYTPLQIRVIRAEDQLAGR